MQDNRKHLYTLTTVWFFWGFVAASNGILIPLFKEKFHLQQWQSQLVDSAFYAAYFVGSLIYFGVSSALGGDILNRIGYKNGIAYGLFLSAIGTLLFIPAANIASFELLLTALFIVGLGFSLQQTATQPFMLALGDPATGSQRINLGGGINNFGTTIGPVLISYAIFGAISEDAAKNATLESIKAPYLILGAMFLLFGVFFKMSSLPHIVNNEKIEKGIGALQYPQLLLGMSAIFVYVGVEVTIGSNLGEYLSKTMSLDSAHISGYVSLFWGSMMVGRWTGALPNFDFKPSTRRILTAVVPFLAFGVVLGVNALKGTNIVELLPYSLSVLVLVLAFFYCAEKPVRTLLVFSLLGLVCMLVGVYTTGMLSLFALISGGLYCSVLWPCIFSLGLAGLGKHTNQGSAFLIMMILGGGIIPVLQGFLADNIGIQSSYLLAALCFAYLMFFAWQVQVVLRKQDIDFDKDITMAAGH